MEQVRDKLENFHEQTKNITYEACLQSLSMAGYTINDSNIIVNQTVYGKLGSLASKLQIHHDKLLKMSFIEQAHKREKCQRLSRYTNYIFYPKLNLKKK